MTVPHLHSQLMLKLFHTPFIHQSQQQTSLHEVDHLLLLMLLMLLLLPILQVTPLSTQFTTSKHWSISLPLLFFGQELSPPPYHLFLQPMVQMISLPQLLLTSLASANSTTASNTSATTTTTPKHYFNHINYTNHFN